MALLFPGSVSESESESDEDEDEDDEVSHAIWHCVLRPQQQQVVSPPISIRVLYIVVYDQNVCTYYHHYTHLILALDIVRDLQYEG